MYLLQLTQVKLFRVYLTALGIQTAQLQAARLIVRQSAQQRQQQARLRQQLHLGM